MTPVSPWASFCVQMEFSAAKRPQRAVSQPQVREGQDSFAKAESRIHFPPLFSEHRYLPAYRLLPRSRIQHFNACTVLPLCRERMLSCILRYAILQVPLIKGEKHKLTNPRLHTACQSQSSYSAPNTQGLQCGMAQCFSCTRLNVKPQYLPAR